MTDTTAYDPSTITVPPGRDSQPPRLVMGLHKSGSTMLNKMMRRILNRLRWPLYDLSYDMRQRGIAERQWVADPALRGLFRPGVVYTGFRFLPDFMDAGFLADTRMALLVRDPRDALVSGYFSFGPGGSHVLPANPALRAAMEAQRSAETGLDIDGWVIHRAPGFARQFMAYAPHRQLPGFRVWRYEDVLFAKAEFLTEVMAHLGLPATPEDVAAVIAQETPLPKVEDPGSHIRKGVPGDHLEKLQPATIARLDAILAEPLRAWGYAP